MNKCLSLVHLIAICFLPFHMASAQTELPQARIVSLNVDPEQVVVLHLRPGYVSSVRVLEEVSSVVLGDPGAFKADHSEAEPQLVFFKATSVKPGQSNALITTRGGHEISLSLVSQGKSDRSEPVDYVLNCERSRGFLIASTHPMFVIGETRNAPENQPTSTSPEKPGRQEQDSLRAERIENPHWEGKQLQVAVGQAIEKEQQMAVPFAVLNSSPRTIEVLPPQVQLAGTRKTSIEKRLRPSRSRSRTTGLPPVDSRLALGPMASWCSTGLLSRNPGKGSCSRLPKRKRSTVLSWHRLRLWLRSREVQSDPSKRTHRQRQRCSHSGASGK